MSKKFCLIDSDEAWKNKRSVGEIDYSILLAHVFEEPIRSSDAFMYLFRRYGIPNELSDDYKDLCTYSFYTADKDIIVRWCIGSGDYHHHLCAFADKKLYRQYAWEPIAEWKRALMAAAEKDGGVYFCGGILSMYAPGKDDTTIFTGDDNQRKHIDDFLKDYPESESNKAFDDLADWMEENDKMVKEKYNIPYPEIANSYDMPFHCQFDNQVEAGKQQHEWILTLPEDHFLRRVYFAAMGLFKSWKRQTYIRDVYFNLNCETFSNSKGNPVEYTDSVDQYKLLVMKNKGGHNADE